MLRPINSFKARSGIIPKFDQGDIITNDGDGNLVLIRNVTSASDGAYYLGWYQHAIPVVDAKGVHFNNGNFRVEYHKVNREYSLYKESPIKLQYYISNDGNVDGDIFKIALGEKEYPIWFEKEYRKIQS